MLHTTCPGRWCVGGVTSGIAFDYAPMATTHGGRGSPCYLPHRGFTKMKQGCCIDEACTEATCMNLPEGKTCRDCAGFTRCQAFLSLSGRETACDWFPRRFREKE